MYAQTMFLNPMIIFNLLKNFIFLCFMSMKYIIISIYLYLKKKQILGYYNSTPLKINLILEIRKMMIKEIVRDSDILSSLDPHFSMLHLSMRIIR
jgi:hypothetical protein